MDQQLYRKVNRVRFSCDYNRIKKMGCKISTPHFVIYVYKNSYDVPRLGLTVSKKTGNAVNRNRIKRNLKEFFRLNKYKFVNSDFSIIALRQKNKLSSKDYYRELSILFGNDVNI